MFEFSFVIPINILKYNIIIKLIIILVVLPVQEKLENVQHVPVRTEQKESDRLFKKI
jgi:hypothetical protein